MTSDPSARTPAHGAQAAAVRPGWPGAELRGIGVNELPVSIAVRNRTLIETGWASHRCRCGGLTSELRFIAAGHRTAGDGDSIPRVDRGDGPYQLGQFALVEVFGGVLVDLLGHFAFRQ